MKSGKGDFSRIVRANALMKIDSDYGSRIKLKNVGGAQGFRCSVLDIQSNTRIKNIFVCCNCQVLFSISYISKERKGKYETIVWRMGKV